MAEQDLITDVRQAKAWVDAQAETVDQLAARLRAVEQAYQTRTGDFANVPRTRPAAVQAMIDAAVDEPGRDLLDDLRPAS